MKNWRGAREHGVRAERLRLRPWTDPRLLLGVLLVLGATVLGARLVAMNDDTVEYWTISHDVRAGDTLSAEQLVATRVQLDGPVSGQYVRVTDDLPAAVADLRWERDVPAGALLDAAALSRRDRGEMRQLPVTVTEGGAPTDLRRGDRVEIWVGPGPNDSDLLRASKRVLGPVRVLRSGADPGSMGGALARTVLVDVPSTALTGEVVSTVVSGRVTLVRVP